MAAQKSEAGSFIPALDDEGVKHLMGVLESVSMGDFEKRVDVEKLDVLGTLGVRINMMIDDLEDMHFTNDKKSRELAAHNEDLDRLVEERTAELQAKLDLITEQNELISMQQAAITELSTPILTLWDSVLALPVIGVVDTRRSAEIMERLLSEITERQSRYVILDITGVEVVDTKTADHFIKVVKASQLLGARCIITGIRPAVAQTLVDIGVDLSSITTLGSLQEGLRECMRLNAATTRNGLSRG